MNIQERRAEERRQWREKEAKDIESAKEEMAIKHGLERDSKFDRAWDIAWNWGHSSGIGEAKLYFDELADLLQ